MVVARFKLSITRNIGRNLGVVVVDGKVQDITPELVAEVRKEFRRIGPKDIRRVLLRNVEKGISPVSGKGRFKRYSKSYVKEILRGKSKRMRRASPTKRRSPVSMRLSGEMNSSLKLFTSGGFYQRFRLNFNWDNFLADIHDRLGASKSKVIRRLLPTREGEEFNETINGRILDRLNDSARNVIRRFFA